MLRGYYCDDPEVMHQNDVCLYPSLEKDGYKWTDLEVIGNIHQNPELKENQK